MNKEHMNGKGPYRAPDGIIFGVAKGLADHFSLSVFWLRIGLIICAFLTGLWPVVIFYIAASLLMTKAPHLEMSAKNEKGGFQYFNGPQSVMQSLEQSADALEKRLRHLENTVTSKGFDWERRLHNK